MREKADTDMGWFKVADDLAQGLARANLTANEYSICCWVLCRTYAMRTRLDGGKFVARKFTPYTARRIAADVGRDHRGITRSLYDLIGPGRQVLRIGEGQEIGFNTRLGTWAEGLIRGEDGGWEAGTPVPARAGIGVGGAGTPVPTKGDARPHKRGRLSPPPGAPSLYEDRAGARARGEGEKRTTTPYPLKGEQGGGIEASFNVAWAIYPEHRQGARVRALRAWRHLNPSIELVTQIMAAIRAQRGSLKWAENGGQYVPRFDRWIRNARWKDRLQAAPAAAPTGPRCRSCQKQTEPGARFCAECAWCWKCDESGRESKKDPREMVELRDKPAVCRACAAGERK